MGVVLMHGLYRIVSNYEGTHLDETYWLFLTDELLLYQHKRTKMRWANSYDTGNTVMKNLTE